MKGKTVKKEATGFEKLVQENKIGRPFAIARFADKPGKLVISDFGKVCVIGIVICITALGLVTILM